MEPLGEECMWLNCSLCVYFCPPSLSLSLALARSLGLERPSGRSLDARKPRANWPHCCWHYSLSARRHLLRQPAMSQESQACPNGRSRRLHDAAGPPGRSV